MKSISISPSKIVIALAVSFLLLTVSPVLGQSEWEFGPALGGGLSDIIRTQVDNDRYESLLGYHLGIEARNKISDHAIFRGQLRYASAGAAIERSSLSTYLGRDVLRINYLDLPVQLSIDFGKPNGFLLTFGLHGSMGVGGKQKTTSASGETDEREVVFSQTIKDDPNVVDYQLFFAGWRFGFGIKKNNVIFDALIASTFSEAPRKPFIITIKGGFAIMINQKPKKE